MDRQPFVLDPAGGDLHGESARLREAGPAVRVVLPGGVRAWSINRYDVAKRLLTDPQVTKSARAHWPAFRNGEIPADWEMISWVAMDNMSTAYGKDHLRLRRLVGKAFSPARVESVRPRVRRLTDELLDALEAAGTPDGVVDLRARFAYPLPARLVADLVGMSQAALTQTAQVMDMMVDTTVTPGQAQATLRGWRQAMADLIADKRRNPAEDIATDLVAARDEDGSRLTERELADSIFAILGAGTETTINFLDNAVTALLSHPEQRRLVTTGQISWDDLIDETLRVQSPIAHLPLRYAAADIQLDHITIRRGDPILVNYAAIGRDPALHGDAADRFDVTRADKTHLSFGHGPHYCLGAGIARLVAAIGLSSLFHRFPGLTLAVPPQELRPLPTFIMNGHRALPVRLAGDGS